MIDRGIIKIKTKIKKMKRTSEQAELEIEKECQKCGIVKPLEEFYRLRKGFREVCKLCYDENEFWKGIHHGAEGSSNNRPLGQKYDFTREESPGVLGGIYKSQLNRCKLSSMPLSIQSSIDFKLCLSLIDKSLGYVQRNIQFMIKEFVVGHDSCDFSRDIVLYLQNKDPHTLEVPSIEETLACLPPQRTFLINDVAYRKCSFCDETKLEVENFHFRKDSLKYRSECKPCWSKKQSDDVLHRRKHGKKGKKFIPEREGTDGKTEYECIKCFEFKRVEEYPTSKGKRVNQCKICKREQDRIYNSGASGFLKKAISNLKQKLKDKVKEGRDMELTIDLDTLCDMYREAEGRCHISGFPLKLTTNDKFQLSLERLNNTKGYTRENCVLVCLMFNCLHPYLHWTPEKFQQFKSYGPFNLQMQTEKYGLNREEFLDKLENNYYYYNN